jgi:tRNA (guanine37-N1)-methyltransferase
MNFHIITLFPDAFDSYLGESILKRAIEDKKIKVAFYNPRDFSDNKFRHIDRPPYAGGPGMVIQAEPVARAVDAALKKISVKINRRKNYNTSKKPRMPLDISKVKIIFFSPSGKQFTTDYAKKTAQKFSDIILICGRYEGIDARVKKIFKCEEISVGPFVLTGGELPAMIFLDCISRQVEGVLGNFDSLEESRTASPDVYTRPEVLEYKDKKYRVPKVLLSGDHKKIEEWKKNRK